MKRVLALTLLAALLLGACEKEGRQTTQGQTPNRVIALSNGAKTGNPSFMLIMNMGLTSRFTNSCSILIMTSRTSLR